MCLMDIKTLVANLGGNTQLAQEFNTSSQTISMWIRKQMIPPAHFPKLIELSGGELTFDELYALNAASRPDAKTEAA